MTNLQYSFASDVWSLGYVSVSFFLVFNFFTNNQ
jgi:hypothetical protein